MGSLVGSAVGRSDGIAEGNEGWYVGEMEGARTITVRDGNAVGSK